jgi:hypothetical protein
MRTALRSRTGCRSRSSVSHGEDRLVDGVGHVTLHLRRPDAVAQAIQDLLVRIGG